MLLAGGHDIDAKVAAALVQVASAGHVSACAQASPSIAGRLPKMAAPAESHPSLTCCCSRRRGVSDAAAPEESRLCSRALLC